MAKVKTAKKKTRKKTTYKKCKVRGCEKRATNMDYCYYHWMNTPEISPYARVSKPIFKRGAF